MVKRLSILTLLVMFLVLSAGISAAQNPLVYTVAMTEAHTKLVSQSPYVSPTLSCNASLALDAKGPLAKFVVGVSAGHKSGSYIPRHNLYAYKITDPSAKGPKKTVLIQTGNHNTETTGSWSFQGMVDFLISSDPRAGWLRRHGEFYVYPLVNPDGRFTARGRGNPEMLEKGILSGSGKLDHNRVWNRQGQGLSTIDALTAAMRKDTGKEVDYYFDFHDGSEIKIPFYNTVPDLMDSPFSQAMIALDVEITPNASNGDPGMGRIWGMTAEGLNSKFACTPESAPKHPGVDVDMCVSWGRYYGIALYNTLINELDAFVYSPAITEEHTQIVARNPYVTPTPSCKATLALNPKGPLAKFVVGVSAGHKSDPYIPRHNLYAYKITDPSVRGPKKTVLIQTGNHNTEQLGSWAFQGMVDFILSSDPKAVWLRRHTEFYIYPLVNPDGRYTRKGRGNPEMLEKNVLPEEGNLDHNRVWDRQGEGLSTIDAFVIAMQKDTGKKIDFFFDYHCCGGHFFTVPALMDCPYCRAMIELDVGIPPKASDGHHGMGRIWGMTEKGLNAKYAFTPELNGDTVIHCLNVGRNYAIALHNTLNAPVDKKEPALITTH